MNTNSEAGKRGEIVSGSDHQVCAQEQESAELDSVNVKGAQSCPTLCDPMVHPVHGILQARMLEWGAFPFSRGSSQPRDQAQVSRFAGGFFSKRKVWSSMFTAAVLTTAKTRKLSMCLSTEE